MMTLAYIDNCCYFKFFNRVASIPPPPISSNVNKKAQIIDISEKLHSQMFKFL